LSIPRISIHLANRMKNFRAHGTSPNQSRPRGLQFTGLDATEGFLKALTGRIHIGPEIDYLERAFDASKVRRIFESPWSMSHSTILHPRSLLTASTFSPPASIRPITLKEGNWDSRAMTWDTP